MRKTLVGWLLMAVALYAQVPSPGNGGPGVRNMLRLEKDLPTPARNG